MKKVIWIWSTYRIWEVTKARRVTWSDLWQMSQPAIVFLLHSVYDLLPTPANLKLWKFVDSNLCVCCGVEHRTLPFAVCLQTAPTIIRMVPQSRAGDSGNHSERPLRGSQQGASRRSSPLSHVLQARWLFSEKETHKANKVSMWCCWLADCSWYW